MRRVFKVVGSLVVLVLAVLVGCSAFESTEDPTTPTNDGGSPESTSTIGDGGGQLDTDAGRSFRYVFITSVHHNGQFSTADDGGLSAADDFCGNVANVVPELRNLRWRAWLSMFKNSVVEQFDARDRISDGGVLPYEYRLVDGETIVLGANYHFIAQKIDLQNLIVLDEKKQRSDAGAVWTGSNNDGTAAYDNTCSNWTYTNASGFTGLADDADQWCGATNGATVGDDRKCTAGHPVYCFEVDP